MNRGTGENGSAPAWARVPEEIIGFGGVEMTLRQAVDRGVMPVDQLPGARERTPGWVPSSGAKAMRDGCRHRSAGIRMAE